MANGLGQGFSIVLMFWPFNTVPHVVTLNNNIAFIATSQLHFCYCCENSGYLKCEIYERSLDPSGVAATILRTADFG